MTVHCVKLLAGFRFSPKSEVEWRRFLIDLDAYARGPEEGPDPNSDYEDCYYEKIELLIDNLKETFPDVTSNNIVCCHVDEGMEHMIDIGFDVGEYNISGEDEGSRFNMKLAMDAMEEARNPAFAAALSNTFLSKYGAIQEPQLLGQADDCLYCS